MATLGDINYSKKLAVYSCEICAFTASNKNDYARHIKTIKHLGNQNSSKKLADYSCEICAFTASNKNDYARHIKTIKHLGNQNSKKLADYSCENCERVYLHNSSLWRHKQTCVVVAPTDDPSMKELIVSVLKQNAEQAKQNAVIQSTLIELCKTGLAPVTNNTNNTTNNNTTNNTTFNLQFFLNDTCKDAMNLTDFIQSVTIQLTDIPEFHSSGYVKTMTNIIVSNLNLLGYDRRPIHCSDVKRDTLYVKDNDEWFKEDDKKKRMIYLVRRIDVKLRPLLLEFTRKYNEQEQLKPHTDKEHNHHQQTICEIVGGKNEDEENNQDIIRNITKNITIPKCK